MERLINWSEKSSIHGIRNFIQSGSRSYYCRVLWGRLFTAFVVVFIYLQAKLFYDIIFKQPTTVEVNFEQVGKIKNNYVLTRKNKQKF